MIYFALTPQDAWFFRDGRPYNHGESNQADVESMFPPPARTVTGSLRAALARANGWSGKGRWIEKLNDWLGNGPNDLGKLQFTGPFLLQKRNNGLEAFWPMPRHVLGRVTENGWLPAAWLHPSDRECLTDRGSITLTEIVFMGGESSDGLKPAGNWWVTASGLARVLTGQLPPPGEIVPSTMLWKKEPRVAFKRHEQTHLVEEGDLYSPSYVRLFRDAALGAGIAGVPDGMKSLPELFPLGGESRLTHSKPWQGKPLPDAPPAESFNPGGRERIEFAVILLTSGRFADVASHLPATRVISACVEKSVYIGGWNSLKGEPLPLEPFHPAGSVWFCEAPGSEFPAIYALHGKWIGDYTAHGFGQIAIGGWPSNPSEKY